jgi:hypothetical protein
MRNFINILLESSLPRALFHGTSEDAWANIKATDKMMAMEMGGMGDEDRTAISFTATRRVAEEFAREAAKNDGCEEGVVICFDPAKLSRLYPLSPYHDPNMSGSWTHFMDEEEYRIEQTLINGMLAAVTSTYTIHVESSPEFHDRKTNSDIVRDAVEEVRNSAAPNFQGACEGAVGDLSEILTEHGIAHEVVEGQYRQPMDWGDGTTHPFTPHWWIEVKGYILDPTREQFGSSNLIVNKLHSDARMYRHGGVGQI